MSLQPIRNVLQVFLASPGDVVDERRSAREVVDIINRIYSRDLGWHIELLGWEDTLPGAGRPQELINADVDVCHLFVGIVWARWGTPTGKFDSGFEEEFERARTRYREEGTPEIWLFFKQVDSDRLRDPGPQLQRVQSFRSEQITRREVFFKEFANDSDWRELFLELLSRYLLKIALPRIQEASGSLPTGANSTTTASSVQDVTTPSPVSAHASGGHLQLRGLAGKVTDILNNSDIDSESQLLPLDQFEIARLYLLASTLMSENYTGDLIGVHEINVMYLQRETIEVTGYEKSLLLRTLVGNTNNTVPGFYWFRDLSLDQFILLLSFFISDSNNSVRLRAIRLLEQLNVSPSEVFTGRIEALLAVLKDEDYTIRAAGFRYFASAGTTEDIPLLNSLAEDESNSYLRNEAIFARGAIYAKTDPERSFAELVANPQLNIKEYLKFLATRASGVSTEALISAVKSTSEYVREFALSELRRRGELSVELANSMLADSSEAVREICYLWLIEQGEQVDPSAMMKNLKGQWSTRRRMAPSTSITSEENPNAVIMALLQKLPLEELNSLVDWYEFIGTNAYKARGLFHFNVVADELRSDLETGFIRIKEESDERLRSKYGSAAEELIQQLENFNRGEFTVAALAAIGANGEPKDIEIGRRYLADSDSDVVDEAILIVERLGDLTDVDSLIEVARKNSYSATGVSAARAAIKLSPGINGAVRAVLATNTPDLVRVAVKSVLDEDKASVAELLKPLLYSNNDNVRLKILSFFIIRYTESELESLLIEYTEPSRYFYNVVCYLDKVLYAPSPLQTLARRDMELELEAQTSK
jgi:HEAT repeat protein